MQTLHSYLAPAAAPPIGRQSLDIMIHGVRHVVLDYGRSRMAGA
jgi:hypothetical protein